MLEKAINNYYTFFDETLQSSTSIVLIITLIICMVGVVVPSAHAGLTPIKGSILETSTISPNTNTVVINGKQYQVTFTQLKQK